MKTDKKTKVILLDGTWNLKRNYYPPHRKVLTGANGKLCGGTFGFLDSTRSVLNKIMPDRVVVAWDGFHAGKMRYNIYKPYKAGREKDWENETRIIATEGVGNADDAEKFQLLSQKIDIQTYLDELFVRQLEADYIEADDFIAYYILGSTDPNEHIYIFSRDKDFYQLVSEKVSIITPDSFDIVTVDNFKEKFGYTVENALLFKCFEGDSSDDIEGVKGITTSTILKNFPDSANEKYTYSRLVEESYKINEARTNGKPKKKPLDTLKKIIDSEHILYRNAKLMNLKKPFLNQEAIDMVDSVRLQPLECDRSIEVAMEMFAKDGMVQHIWDRNLHNFFGPFYNLKSKEKEYEESLK
jgi:DNA polymerase I